MNRIEEDMERRRESFINNFSEKIQDIELLKTIYEIAFMEGVNYALHSSLESMLKED